MSPNDVTTAITTALPRPAAGPLGLPRLYWLLWAGTLVNRLGGAVVPFLGIYLTGDRGLTPARAGLVVGLHAAGGMIAGPVGGALADRLGRRRTLLLGTGAAAAVMTALAGARDLRVIACLAALLGLATDLCRPALMAAVTDLVAAKDRTRAFGLLYWAINLGFAGAAVSAGAIAAWSFGWLFVIDAATTLAFGAAIYWGLPETRPPLAEASTESASTAGTAMARPATRWLRAGPLADRRLLAFLLVQWPVMAIFAQGIVTLSLELRGRGLEMGTIGRLLAINGLVIIVCQPIALRFAERIGRRRLLVLAALLIGAGFGMTGLARGPAGYAASIVVWTLGEIAFFLVTPAVVADLAPPDRRGAYQGALHLAFGLANVAAPALGALVLTELGSRTLWNACLVLGLAAAATHTLTLRGRWAAPVTASACGPRASPGRPPRPRGPSSR